jgi:5-methylcytosine-specific restriction endonuclease McrA
MDDRELGLFREYKRQDKESVEIRDSVVRMAFFKQCGPLLLKDRKRIFNEAERITLSRDTKALCQMCLAEGKNEREARVSWGEYHADHILPWILGGETKIEKAQVLCRTHNLQKGARQDDRGDVQPA